ncbi:MAG: alpha/beta hydrolase [Betaproteobacteria bacterium]|nr:alpha/beta hydrolase [Betaproteobacteria bacterium]
MLWNILIPVAMAYAAVLVLVFLFQSRLVYYPEIGREVRLSPQSYGLKFEPVEIRTADDEILQGWWVPAENARGAVLFFHGNAGNISHRLDYLLMFHRLRYTTLIVDYRGYGLSTGTPSEEGTYRDAEAAWDYLRHARLARAQDVVIAGESLGAAVATWLAAKVSLKRATAESGPRAVLLFSTFTSATDLGAQVYWFLPVRLISRFGYDNLANLKRIRAPVFIAHSRDDDIVPYVHGKRLFEAANEPKAFLEMRGGHNDGFVFARPEWVARLAEFLDRHNGQDFQSPQETK